MWKRCALFAALTLGCADDTTEAELPDPPFETESFAPVACDLEQPLPLESIPNRSTGMLLFFYQLRGTCTGLSSTAISFVNTSGEEIVVDTIRSSAPPFYVAKESLPQRLAPGGRLKVRLSYLPKEPGEIGSLLTVASGPRCARVQLIGRAIPHSEDGLVSYSPEVLDFGTVARNSQSTQQFELLLQRGGASPKDVIISGFGASPSLFEIGQRTETEEGSDCRRIRAPVTFHAGTAPGTVKGGMAWDIEGGGFIGLQLVELIATVE